MYITRISLGSTITMYIYDIHSRCYNIISKHYDWIHNIADPTNLLVKIN
jgi:hypothetical protein